MNEQKSWNSIKMYGFGSILGRKVLSNLEPNDKDRMMGRGQKQDRYDHLRT